MKRNWLIGAVLLAVAATALPTDTEAKRLGGGGSAGMQRNMPARTAPDAIPAKPAAPAQGQQAAPAGAPAAAPAAAAPKRSWMGPLAGLAAGLGIAALMSHLGMGEAFGNFLMLALLGLAAVFVIGFLLRRFGPARTATPALAGAGAGAGGFGGATPRTEPTLLQRTAQAEPAAVLPAAASAGSGAAAPQAGAITRAFVPASFDSEGFARTAKLIFIRMQAANDSADLDDLRRFTTPELFAEIRLELQERGPSGQQTDVVKVDAEVLDVADEGERQIVSVRFHGQMIEDKGAAPAAFDEIWHLVKPHDDSRPWAIAGIEQHSH